MYGSLDDADYQPSSTHRRRGYDAATAGRRYGLDLSKNGRLTQWYHHADNKSTAPRTRMPI